MPRQPKAREAQCYVWDITLRARDVTPTYVSACLRTLCKKFAFQLERGEKQTEANPEGYLHYQGRISFFKKCFHKAAVSHLLEHFEAFHVSPSSEKSLKGDSFYVLKDQTREDGPWSDKDVAPVKALKQDMTIEENGLYPWQNDILLKTDAYDERKVHCIIDPRGNNGKSKLIRYVAYKQIGTALPPMNDYQDVMAMIMCKPKVPLYLIDMPRALKQNQLSGLYSAIESVKNGYCFDKRYNFKDEWFDCPNIIVFSNIPPKLRYLSMDRWQLWTINSDKELVPYVFPKKNGVQAQGDEEVVEEENSDQEEVDV